MAKQPAGHSIPLLDGVGQASGQPRYLRLYQRIRAAILEGTVPPGTRLPSARTLAREEGLSRNTVEAALGQLQAEGFVVRRVGAGSWVSDRLPSRPLRPGRRDVQSSPWRASSLSERGRRLAEVDADPTADQGLHFAPCAPALDAIPLGAWGRITARLARRASGSLLLAPPSGGLPGLRGAIASYLGLGRGVRCSPEQVVIVNSTQQAIDLTIRLLLDPGDTVWFEDPGYPLARQAFDAGGARLAPVPVDEDGLEVDRGIVMAPDARLAYVTPSHQYPLGVTLSLERRLELLEWSAGSGGWILEDDYDSELRYDGRPHASVQGIGGSGRVIYAGTFNKILFPGLRMAYLVLPPGLVEAFERARALADGFVSPLTQQAMAEFIQDGHYSIHLRRVRALYQERRDRFLELAARELPDSCAPGSAAAGMHLALHLPVGTDDVAISARARRRGLAVPALSTYCLGPGRPGLLVHYGNVPLSAMATAVGRLGEALRSTRPAPRPQRRA